MPLQDYAHWNEEAMQVWWQEEGKHHDADLQSHYDRELDEPDWYVGEDEDEAEEDEDWLNDEEC